MLGKKTDTNDRVWGVHISVSMSFGASSYHESLRDSWSRETLVLSSETIVIRVVLVHHAVFLFQWAMLVAVKLC
jgi:hypothetical protein